MPSTSSASFGSQFSGGLTGAGGGGSMGGVPSLGLGTPMMSSGAGGEVSTRGARRLGPGSSLKGAATFQPRSMGGRRVQLQQPPQQ